MPAAVPLIVGASAPLIIGATVFGAISSRDAAKRQNEAIKKAGASTQQAATIQSEQVVNAARLERRKLALAAAQVEGRIRALAFTSGQGTSGSFGTLIRQNTITDIENEEIININLQSQIAAIRTGAQAQVDQLGAGLTSPSLAGITGGLGGLSTGLSIVTALSGIGELLNPPTPVTNDPKLAARITTGLG